MTLRAIQNRSLADQVFEQLAAEVLTGRYVPGANLPAERTLAEVFDVNRHVVREALKRLEQIGLVKISQGGGTKVLDFKRHAGLDVLAMMAEHAHASTDVLAYRFAVLEMRAAIGADLARLCAKRASEEVRKDLVAIATQMRATTDDHERFALEVRFWNRIQDGADNIAYRLAFNTLVRGAFSMGEPAREWSLYEMKRTDRMIIAEAIVSGDADRAENVVRTAMRSALETFEGWFDANRAAQTSPSKVPEAK